MPQDDDGLTPEQEALVVELSETGSAELASSFAAFIRAHFGDLDTLPAEAAMVALLNAAVGPAVMLFDQLGDAADIDANAEVLEDRFKAMTVHMEVMKGRH